MRLPLVVIADALTAGQNVMLHTVLDRPKAGGHAAALVKQVDARLRRARYRYTLALFGGETSCNVLRVPELPHLTAVLTKSGGFGSERIVEHLIEK
jgi:hypothetical protein